MTQFRYKIIPELMLIVEYFSGKIDLVDINTCMERLIKDPNYNPIYNIIRDGRDSHLVITPNALDNFVATLQSRPNYFGKRKTAILISKPNETAFSIVFIAKTKKFSPEQIEIFSTIGSVMKFLDMIGDNRKIIEKTLIELKTNAEENL